MQINTEYRKGILFVRLVGRLDNGSFLDDINKLIEEVGIKYIVLNLTKVSNVSLDSIGYIIDYNNQILKKKKHLFICDITDIRDRLFKDIIPKLREEIEAFSLI